MVGFTKGRRRAVCAWTFRNQFSTGTDSESLNWDGIDLFHTLSASGLPAITEGSVLLLPKVCVNGMFIL